MKSTIITLLSLILLAPLFAYASESNGAISAGYGATKICKDPACSTFGNINWKPTLNGNTTGATVVTITDSGLSGNLWGDEIGWVNLAPTGSGVTINATTGALSGYAYAQTGGWINFRPTQVLGNPTVGVSIDSSGQFVGYAYVSGLNGGWMKFDCASSTTCIKTDWRPIPNRTVVVSSSANANGVVGLQYITQPIQPQPIATSTTGSTTSQNPDRIQVFQKPARPTTHISTKPGGYTGWVASSANLNFGGSTTTEIEVNGEPIGKGGGSMASSTGAQVRQNKEHLLAYPFIPERAKWRVPTSRILPAVQTKAHVAIPDVDGTSLLLTVVLGAFLWKIGMLAVFAIAALFR